MSQGECVPLPSGLHYWQPYQGVPSREVLSSDICVYGANAAGCVAAIQSARSGRSVVLLEPGRHLGGLTAGGLGWTDFGNKAAIGGLSREFYRELGKAYGVAEEWLFDPHVAQATLARMLSESGVTPRYGQFLKSVRMEGGRIAAIRCESGLTVRAQCYIDCSYEGDLMARARVRYAIGREANSCYGETINGIQLRDKHQFEVDVDPYVRCGDPTSGLLPGIDPSPVGRIGAGDRSVQAYCFRLCLTRDPANRIPWAKPEGYDRSEYELLARVLAAGSNQVFGKFDRLRSGKYDKNNHGAVSTDYIGRNHRFPRADYAEREAIFHAHVVYQMGLMWFLANDPAVPAEIRQGMAEYGLCRDEFTDTGGWPFQLYIREARRMVSDYVVTELDCVGKRRATDAVGLGSYGMDSHNCRRVVVNGHVRNEGDVQVGGFPPYPIPYRAIVPAKGQCTNLLVPVCASASHIAYGSLRMEPVFMVLAQSAAIAADLALAQGVGVQDVPYRDLGPRLLEAGQQLEWTGR